MDVSNTQWVFSKTLSQEEKDKQLLEAARDNDAMLIEQWVEVGANLQATHKNGYTVLDWAAYHGNVPLLTLLLKKNIDPNLKGVNGCSPLYSAVGRGHMPAAKLLIEQGANLGFIARGGNTLLHLAVIQGHKEIVALLTQYGAKLDTVNESGHTSLHFAAMNGNVEIVALLTQHGAKLDTVNDYGKTPMMYLMLCEDKVKKIALMLKLDVNKKCLPSLLEAVEKNAFNPNDISKDVIFCLSTFMSLDEINDRVNTPEVFRVHFPEFKKQLSNCYLKLSAIVRPFFLMKEEEPCFLRGQPTELFVRQIEFCFPEWYQHLISPHLDIIIQRCKKEQKEQEIKRETALFYEIPSATPERQIEIIKALGQKYNYENGLTHLGRFYAVKAFPYEAAHSISSSIFNFAYSYVPSFSYWSNDTEMQKEEANKRKREENEEGQPEPKRYKRGGN